MNILVKFRRSDEFIIIKTFDRKHGRSHNFYMTTEHFTAWLMNGIGSFHDRDCMDYLTIYRESDESFYVTLVWLSECSNGDVSGYTQKFSIPKAVLMPLIRSEIEETSYLANTDMRVRTEVHLSPKAHAIVGEMPPQIRRAFSKFMRSHFRYAKPSCIEIFADGKADFYFRDTCPDGFCMNGGIILSTVDRRYRNGTAYCHRYSMHT